MMFLYQLFRLLHVGSKKINLFLKYFYSDNFMVIHSHSTEVFKWREIEYIIFISFCLV